MKAVKRFQAELTIAPRCKLGESPLWYGAELCYVDIELGLLHRFNPSTNVGSSLIFEAPLGCFAKSDSGYVIGGSTGFLQVNDGGKPKGTWHVHTSGEGLRMNDGGVDPLGRFWACSMDATAKGRGQLFRYGAQGAFANGLNTGNGLAFSPDGRHMYLSDSHASRQMVWRYDYDLDAATPSNPKPFIDFNELDGRPDGGTIDVDGCYWIAAIDAGCVYRFTPQGQLDMVVDVPVEKPTKPVFGGSDLRTMYITSLQVGDDGGGVYAVNLPVQGLPTPLVADGDSQSI